LFKFRRSEISLTLPLEALEEPDHPTVVTPI